MRTDSQMTRLMISLGFVIASILIGGIIGGFVGREVGRHSPSFVKAIAGGPQPLADHPSQPAEFGYGLGIVSGLFFGAGIGLFLVLVHAIRDAWLARLAIVRELQGVARLTKS